MIPHAHRPSRRVPIPRLQAPRRRRARLPQDRIHLLRLQTAVPRLPDRGRKVHARVVGVVRGVERGVGGGGFAPELVQRRVEEDVAVGGVGGEQVERGVAGADDGDGAGDDGGAVEVC